MRLPDRQRWILGSEWTSTVGMNRLPIEHTGQLGRGGSLREATGRTPRHSQRLPDRLPALFVTLSIHRRGAFRPAVTGISTV